MPPQRTLKRHLLANVVIYPETLPLQPKLYSPFRIMNPLMVGGLPNVK